MEHLKFKDCKIIKVIVITLKDQRNKMKRSRKKKNKNNKPLFKLEIVLNAY